MSAQFVLVETAKSITAALTAAATAGEFAGLLFEAKRRYPEAVEREEITAEQGLLVDVVGGNARDGGAITQTRRKWSVSADVYVRQKFDQGDRDQQGNVRIEIIDRLVGLVQEIRTYFDDRAKRLTFPEGSPILDSVFDDGQIIISWDRERLRENKQHFGAVKLIFAVYTSINPPVET